MYVCVDTFSKPAASESVLTALYLNVGLEKGVLMRVAVDPLTGKKPNSSKYSRYSYLHTYIHRYIHTYIHSIFVMQPIYQTIQL